MIQTEKNPLSSEKNDVAEVADKNEESHMHCA